MEKTFYTKKITKLGHLQSCIEKDWEIGFAKLGSSQDAGHKKEERGLGSGERSTKSVASPLVAEIRKVPPSAFSLLLNKK